LKAEGVMNFDFVLVKDAVLLVLGALLGVFAPEMYKHFAKRHADARGRAKAEERNKATDPARVSQYLTSHYLRDPESSHVFTAKVGSHSSRIPFLSEPSWQLVDSGEETPKVSYLFGATPDLTLAVDHSLIDFRRKLGQRIWDAPAMFCSGIVSQGDGNAQIRTGKCDYLAVVSSTIRAEERVFDRVRCQLAGEQPRVGLPSLRSIREGQTAPTLIGCAVLFAFRKGDTYSILLGTRSKETATFGGTLGTLPNYGLTPKIPIESSPLEAEDSDPRISFVNRYTLSTFNFVKEFAEELYGNTALDNPLLAKKLSDTWFYELPECKKLLHWMKEDKVDVRFLGFGFDLLNCGCVLAHLAVVDDPTVGDQLLNEIRLNWEITHHNSRAGFMLVPLDSPILEHTLRDHMFHAGAAFALTLAIRALTSSHPLRGTD
jgi:hypothetical protein